jgi:hypothetical protein
MSKWSVACKLLFTLLAGYVLSSASCLGSNRYKGLSHTDPIIECPIEGGRDRLLDDIFSVVARGKLTNKHEDAPPLVDVQQTPMAYAWQIRFARYINPF